MSHFMTTEIEGTEYAAENTGGSFYEGLFVRRADGTFQQTLGHSQTPAFRSEGAFRRWVLRVTLDERRAARADREPLSDEAKALFESDPAFALRP